MIKKHIPNFITSLSLTSGLISLYFVVNNDFSTALIMLFVASVFDFLDGAVARLLHVVSPMGKELDSLSDMVVFGLVPGVALHVFVLFQFNLTYPINFEHLDFFSALALFSPLLIVIYSALRLAKFNIDESQTYYFKGLPTPANALFILALVNLAEDQNIIHLSANVLTYMVPLLSLFSAIILVAPIKLFSLKMKNLSLKDNWYRYLFLFSSIILAVILKLNAIPMIIINFIFLSIILNWMGIYKEPKS